LVTRGILNIFLIHFIEEDSDSDAQEENSKKNLEVLAEDVSA